MSPIDHTAPHTTADVLHVPTVVLGTRDWAKWNAEHEHLLGEAHTKALANGDKAVSEGGHGNWVAAAASHLRAAQVHEAKAKTMGDDPAAKALWTLGSNHRYAMSDANSMSRGIELGRPAEAQQHTLDQYKRSLAALKPKPEPVGAAEKIAAKQGSLVQKKAEGKALGGWVAEGMSLYPTNRVVRRSDMDDLNQVPVLQTRDWQKWNEEHPWDKKAVDRSENRWHDFNGLHGHHSSVTKDQFMATDKSNFFSSRAQGASMYTRRADVTPDNHLDAANAHLEAAQVAKDAGKDQRAAHHLAKAQDHMNRAAQVEKAAKSSVLHDDVGPEMGPEHEGSFHNGTWVPNPNYEGRSDDEVETRADDAEEPHTFMGGDLTKCAKPGCGKNITDAIHKRTEKKPKAKADDGGDDGDDAAKDG
jgi:hypothetical protein